MWRRCESAYMRGLEQVEIFLLFPARDLSGVLFFLGAEAGDLGVLDADEIVDEIVAEGAAETRVIAERGQGFAEIFRQQFRFGLIRRIGRRPRPKLCAPTPSRPQAICEAR